MLVTDAVRVTRVGNTCQLIVNKEMNYPTGTTRICTLPIGYRPVNSLYVAAEANNRMRFYVGYDGNVSLYNYNATAGNNVVAYACYATVDPMPEQ